MAAKPRVLVAMSGGVDSSLAAALLVEAGHPVLGATLRFWDPADGVEGKCCSGSAGVCAAATVAAELGIRHIVVDATDAFLEGIVEPCWAAYRRGITPSPCLECNRRLKFGRLLEEARRRGCELLATGHYARLLPDPDGGDPALHRGVDRDKDQSYFLATLEAEPRRHTLLPLGGLTKKEVRALAAERGLATAHKPDSQDACLDVDGLGFAETLRRVVGDRMEPGDFVDPAGRVLGRHRGLHRYTLGQRKGLGIALGAPAYVVALRPERNQVVLSTDEADLFTGRMAVERVGWHRPVGGPLAAEVQVRSRPTPAPATITPVASDRATVVFDTPQRALTPGQAAVFYDGDRVLGAGWIAGPATGPEDGSG